MNTFSLSGILVYTGPSLFDLSFPTYLMVVHYSSLQHSHFVIQTWLEWQLFVVAAI